MQVFSSLIAALTVMVFAIRGADSFALVVIAGVSWAAASILIGAGFRFRPGAMRSNRVWGAVILMWLITFSVVLTRWPLRLGAVIYRSHFQAFADSVASGHAFNTPRHVGPFTFVRGEMEHGFVCLWTDLDPAGRSGFIRGSTERAIPFNLWSAISTGSDWHFIVED